MYEELLRGAGIGDDEPEPTITAHMPADVAVATALLGFVDAIKANLEGTIDDVDTEFLHDLRVAVRRTRSLAITADRAHYTTDFVTNIAVGFGIVAAIRLNAPLIDLAVALGDGE